MDIDQQKQHTYINHIARTKSPSLLYHCIQVTPIFLTKPSLKKKKTKKKIISFFKPQLVNPPPSLYRHPQPNHKYMRRKQCHAYIYTLTLNKHQLTRVLMHEDDADDSFIVLDLEANERETEKIRGSSQRNFSVSI